MHASIPPLSLFAPLTLPNGAVVPNRIAKAAMEENMADSSQLPGENLRRLYASWADGGVGLILSGNVMIDPTALTGPGGVGLGAVAGCATSPSRSRRSRPGRGRR